MSHVLDQDVSSDKETGDSRDELHKVLLIGDSGVGKTCLMQRFVRDKFDDKVSTTIGVDFAVKKVGVNDGYCKLTIWDTAGQERFRTLTSTFYRGARGIILVYDVTSRDSFESLEQSWLTEVKQYCNMRTLAMVVVANKVDKSDERQVSWEEGSNLARRYGCLFVETSAKANLAVALAFEELALQISAAPPPPEEAGTSLDLTGSRTMMSSCTSCIW